MIPLTESPMLAASMRAERDSPGFCERASQVILALLERGETPGEVLVDLARLRGITPADSRAFGAVFKSLHGQGKIRQVGWCLRKKGHSCGGGRIWALV